MNKSKNFNKFSKKREFQPQEKPVKHFISEISPEKIGKLIYLEGVIDGVSQTEGPTLFSLNDGTGVFTLKGFLSPGKRAFEEVEEGSYINSLVKIKEYNDSFEGEIIRINVLEGEERNYLKNKVEKTQRERAKPVNTNFLIKSPILEKMKSEFIKAATEIRLAIIQNRPIIVRHHNDADGYSSGFALERAIIPLIAEQHNSTKSAWEYYVRAPCAAPFYEIDDSIKDTSMSLRNAAKFSNKMPLVIIADNGSTEQDLFGVKQGKIHGIDFIVVDHHFFDKDVISPEVLAHVNPFLVGESGEKLSAGMLCTELARFIYDVKNINQIPAMAGLADRINNPDAMEQYLEIAKQEGYSEELSKDIATVIDFISAKLRFMEAREYIEVLFGEPRTQQKKLVQLMIPYIKNLERKGLEIAKIAAKIEKIKDKHLQMINIEEAFPGFGFYPKPGKCIGMIHDHLKESTPKVISVGIMNSSMTIRATDDANFSVHDLIAYVSKKLPESFVDGGGHKNAGSITFIPNTKLKVLELFKEFISSR